MSDTGLQFLSRLRWLTAKDLFAPEDAPKELIEFSNQRLFGIQQTLVNSDRCGFAKDKSPKS